MNSTLRYFLYTLICFSQTSLASDFLPEVPKGFRVSVFAEVDNARQLAVATDGTVFVGSRGSGQVWALRDLDKDGVAEEKFLIAQNLNSPNGVSFHNKDLYVAEIQRVLRFKNILTSLENPPKAEVVYSDLSDKSHHGQKTIAFDSQNNLIMPVGAPCNICQPDSKRFAHLRKINLDTKNTEIIASGIRNSVGFDWHPVTGKLWFSDNGRDWLGDNLPADELNRLDSNGQHFGFPFVHGDNTKDDEYYNKKPNNLVTQKPAFSMQAHVAPLGIHFYRGETFPKKYQNQLLLAQHGSWNRSKKVGYKVILVTIEGDKVVSSEPFIKGFEDRGKIFGRPVSIVEMDDGAILVSDDAKDTIYRIQYQNIP